MAVAAPDRHPTWTSRARALAGKTSVHVGSAVVVMSGWAAFANRAHGTAPMLTAAVVQGAASALVTFTLKTALEAMARRLAGVPALVVPPTVSCVVVLALLVAAHRLAGTHELWSTIALPYAASSTYAWAYTALVARRRTARRTPTTRAVARRRFSTSR